MKLLNKRFEGFKAMIIDIKITSLNTSLIAFWFFYLIFTVHTNIINKINL